MEIRERILNDFAYVQKLYPRKFFATIEQDNYPFIWRLYFLDNYVEFNIADYSSKSYFKVTFPCDYPSRSPEFNLIQVENAPSFEVNIKIQNFLINISNRSDIVTMRDVARTLQKVIQIPPPEIKNTEDKKEEQPVNNETQNEQLHMKERIINAICSDFQIQDVFLFISFLLTVVLVICKARS